MNKSFRDATALAFSAFVLLAVFGCTHYACYRIGVERGAKLFLENLQRNLRSK